MTSGEWIEPATFCFICGEEHPGGKHTKTREPEELARAGCYYIFGSLGSTPFDIRCDDGRRVFTVVTLEEATELLTRLTVSHISHGT